MQRQSLGSPSSKLHIHGGGGGGGGGGGAKEEILKAEKDLNQSQNDDEADHKSLKPLRSSSSPPDKLIHLIPLLMLFCFLLLYLFSHDPSHSGALLILHSLSLYSDCRFILAFFLRFLFCFPQNWLSLMASKSDPPSLQV